MKVIFTELTNYVHRNATLMKHAVKVTHIRQTNCVINVIMRRHHAVLKKAIQATLTARVIRMITAVQTILMQPTNAVHIKIFANLPQNAAQMILGRPIIIVNAILYKIAALAIIIHLTKIVNASLTIIAVKGTHTLQICFALAILQLIAVKETYTLTINYALPVA